MFGNSRCDNKLRNFSKVCQKMLHYDDLEVQQKSDQLKRLVVKLCDLYASSMGNETEQKSKSSSIGETSTRTYASSSTPIYASSNTSSKKVSGKMADMLEDWDRELEEGDQVVVSHEVDQYLLDPIEKPLKGSKFEILDWWKLNGGKYPSLHAVAKDVLTIQVSTVASESSLNTGKRVIDPYRSSLTPRTVEALICQ